jgi:hypothetical protein
MKFSALGLGLGLGVSAASARADLGADAGAPGPVTSAASNTGACIEHIPEGKQRPAIKEAFPERARAGYAAVLSIEIPHGLGETVLPGGFRLQLDSPEGRAFHAAQFVIPAFEGPAAPRVLRSESEGAAVTTVELPFVPLPKDPGPHTLTLPSVPIAIARQSGELITICTAPHTLLVDDPTANIANASPRPNPKPLRQLEVWTTAKNIALTALIALPLGALIAFIVGRWLRRARPAPPPPPPRPAWEIALEALGRVRHQRLIEQGLTREVFDEVSLAVREYLGRRFGFDGLESTTRELLEHLARLGPSVPPGDLIAEIELLLRRADLVKFANLRPEAAECEIALERGERIVRVTMAPVARVVSEAVPTPPVTPVPPESESLT